MKPREFGWASRSRKLRLCVALKQLLTRWLSEWSLQATHVDVQLREETSPPHWKHVYQWNDALVAVGFESGQLARLGAHLAQVQEGDALIAKDLGNEALLDLVSQMFGVQPTQGVKAVSPAILRSDAFATNSRACMVELRLEAIQFALALNRQALDVLVPAVRSDASLPALVGRETALSQTPADVELVLPLGNFPLSDLLGLVPGDVLASDVPLTTPLMLRSSGRAVSTVCRLAKRGQQKAAYIDDLKDSQ